MRHAGLALVLACFGARGAAQISPGPLARPHQQLEGALQCVKCHGGGRKEQMTARCLECHKEIAWLVGRGRGLHATVRDQRCASCHPDHAGRDFALVTWEGGDPQHFDHTRAGWPLEGSHRKTACADCHKPAFRVSRAAKLSERRGPDWGWVGLERGCVSCHADPHRGRLGAACSDCHTATDWKTINKGKFDHERTRYPLRGRHTAVACDKCHDFSAGGKVIRNPPFATCGDCHQDAHAGTATLAGRVVDCASCHVVDGWRPSTYTVAQHERARYPLEGRHQQVECAACHVKHPPRVAPAALGSAGVWMRPVAARCQDCHGEDHGPQLASRADRGACDKCHRLSGWRPTTFTVADHSSLRLRLEGRHADIECRACHGSDRRGLPALAGVAVLGKAGVAFKLKEVECAACHVDPHDGRYLPCVDCHGVRTFRPSTVDIAAHRRYKFPLERAHAAVPCVDCHAELKHPATTSSLVLVRWTAPRLLFAAPPGGCEGCHQNPHGRQFATRADRGACESCHGTDTFRPATRFDHERDATFSLKGAHATVPCSRCHPSSRGAAGKSVVTYRPVSGKCEACHGDKVREGA
ncbi:MAG TPA: cytochrome c3 family protein [Gemmatimonadales bacterium]|nr:cytochrome c3 family protein [Gemmatimonadales bacterium]